MQRSGSTLQFQIAAHLVEGAGLGQRVPWVPQEDFSRLVSQYRQQPGWKVFKSHQYSPEKGALIAAGEAKGIYIYRDLRAVLASKIRKDRLAFRELYGQYLVEALIETDRQWTAHEGMLVSRYERVIADLPGEVARIAAFLGIDLAPGQPEAVATEFRPEKQRQRIEAARREGLLKEGYAGARFDPHSNLHTDHFSGGRAGAWRWELSPVEIALTEHAAGDWLAERGYPPAHPRAVRGLLLAAALPLRMRRRFSRKGAVA